MEISDLWYAPTIEWIASQIACTIQIVWLLVYLTHIPVKSGGFWMLIGWLNVVNSKVCCIPIMTTLELPFLTISGNQKLPIMANFQTGNFSTDHLSNHKMVLKATNSVITYTSLIKNW